MKIPSNLVALVLGATAISGCAASNSIYPSLSIRDFERGQGSFDAPQGSAPIEIAPLPQDKAARIVALLEQLQASHARFMSEAPVARNAVVSGAGSAAGEDRWAAAQVALASLDSERSQAAVALADLDLMVADTSLAVERVDDVVAAREVALARLREQDAILAELRGVLDR
ncbi:hypothetical protein [Parerythrobacter lacustris]|uniref:DUF4398 domain-containing protein n=1 Tax=Parerythrobacter lacustris TaxID=2969984 RepID=A0ABT1XTX3_9SPHN|nr:hypothetical protein [Parerythrobacter lacustris]MCR2835123.1 hypothetical protein [Parerythrobacter lacustris]